MHSIIIPTLNRSFYLEKLLNSIADSQLDNSKTEFIIIDNGSTDSTEKIVSDFIKKNEKIKVIYCFEPEPGLLSGRHLGAKIAKGDIISFLDDDVILPPLWVNNVVQVVNQYTEYDLFTGSNLPFYENYPPDWLEYFWNSNFYGGRTCFWLSLLDLGTKDIEVHPNFVFGLNFTIRRNVLEKLGGFHPDCVPVHLQHFQGDGETGLSKKALKNGSKSLYSPKLTLYHQVPSSRMTYEYFAKRAFFQGVADSYTKCREIAFPSQAVVPRISVKKLIYRKLVGTYKKVFKKPLQDKRVVPEHVLEMKKKIDLEYKRGFDFHQKVFAENSVVRNWVLRDNYIDYTLPK